MSEIQSWSVTAASNNSASPDGWPESMAPSGINNSARENMAAMRRLYGDWNGSLSSGGSSNAYTLSPNRTISAYAAGIDFLFLANHANTSAATLNVSSLGAKDLRDKNGDALVGAEIEQYTPVHAVYDNTNGYFRCTNLTAAAATTNPDASETVKGLVELATAAEALAGSSQTLAVTPYALANAGASFSANGYYKLPGGLIIQWGSGSMAPSTTTALTFPLTFPTACVGIALANRENASYARGVIHITTYSSSGVTIYSGDTSTHYAHYIAIGY